MEEELVQFETPDGDVLPAEAIDDDVIADKKKGGDEDGIIAILIG